MRVRISETICCIYDLVFCMCGGEVMFSSISWNISYIKMPSIYNTFCPPHALVCKRIILHSDYSISPRGVGCHRNRYVEAGG